MSFSSGTFSINSAGQPVVTGTVISSTAFNSLTSDLATGLSTCVLKDGTQTLTANIPMSSFKFTGLGSGSARTDSINAGQVQDGSFIYISTVGGTADAITLTPSPAITSYTAGKKFSFIASGANTGAVTVTISGVTPAVALTKNGSTALVANDIASGALIQIEHDGTRFQLSGVIGISATLVTAKGDLLAATASGVVARVAVGSNGQFLQADSTQTSGVGWGNPSKVCEGRITLTTATPVTSSDVTAATTVYFTPYMGDGICLYDGTNWRIYTFTERSIAVPATTATMYDLFIYDNAGTLTLVATAWSTDTARATPIVLQNGVYVKSGTATQRYLGSFRTTAVSGQTEDSLANRFVWNYYNRVARPMKAVDTANSWNYTLAAFQQANASTANQLNFILGASEDAVTATVVHIASNTSGSVIFSTGIGLDSTTVNSARMSGAHRTAGASVEATVTASYNAIVTGGRHYLAWLEYSEATGVTTWLGDGNVTFLQTGITGTVLG